MIEKITAIGKVTSVSDPFLMDRTSIHLITVRTNRGLFSIPVDNPSQYKINEDVEVIVTVKSKDEGV